MHLPWAKSIPLHPLAFDHPKVLFNSAYLLSLKSEPAQRTDMDVDVSGFWDRSAAGLEGKRTCPRPALFGVTLSFATATLRWSDSSVEGEPDLYGHVLSIHRAVPARARRLRAREGHSYWRPRRDRPLAER
jgi:hypothetical protein